MFTKEYIKNTLKRNNYHIAATSALINTLHLIFTPNFNYGGHFTRRLV